MHGGLCDIQRLTAAAEAGHHLAGQGRALTNQVREPGRLGQGRARGALGDYRPLPIRQVMGEGLTLPAEGPKGPFGECWEGGGAGRVHAWLCVISH